MRFPSGLQFTAPEFPLSGLYVNTLLANLNARQFLRSSAGSDAERGGYELDRRTGNSSLRFSSAVPSAGRTTNNVTQVGALLAHVVGCADSIFVGLGHVVRDEGDD